MWEGQMKSRFREEIKGWSERHFIFRGGRKSIILLEGSQATPAESEDVVVIGGGFRQTAEF
jgi:hypothetical protein